MAEIIDLQAPGGLPRSSDIKQVSDPIIAPRRTQAMLDHFSPKVYDLRHESHLSRLLKVLLGDSGAGQMRKRHLHAHLSQVLTSRHFYALDRTFADAFTVSRLLRESLDVDPYEGVGTQEEWESVFSSDASYRNRVEQFARAIHWGGSPTGLKMVAEAMLGVPCRITETYEQVDREKGESPEPIPPVPDTLYGELEENTYGELNGLTYGRMENTHRQVSGHIEGSRSEFVVVPSRRITDEEHYALLKVLNRLRPANTLMTIDPTEKRIYAALGAVKVHAPSTYWEVRRSVAAPEAVSSLYGGYNDGRPTPVRQPAFTSYQGEAWSHNDDIVSVSAYSIDADGEVISEVSEDVKSYATEQVVYTAASAVSSSRRTLLGRVVSDGTFAAPVSGGDR